MRPNKTLGLQDVNRFLTSLFDGDPHAKRVLSLANATLGVIRTAPLAVNIPARLGNPGVLSGCAMAART
jgi:hypothetical protein